MGFSEKNSLLITAITGVVKIVTTLIAIATIAKFGRKPLLVLGSIGMTVTTVPRLDPPSLKKGTFRKCSARRDLALN